MKKRKSKAFGKEIYLLGKDKKDTKYWLEEPTWDCGWYWGFGYIETYTHSHPHMAKDIVVHLPWSNCLQSIKFPKYVYGMTVEPPPYNYISNPYDNPYLREKTFSEKEGWELGELFRQFYFLQEAAEMFKRGKAHVASSKISLWKDESKSKEINEQIIPKVTSRILEILSPDK